MFVARGLAFWDFVPIWDGRIYADCVVAGRFWDCCGHPTGGHLGILMLSQLAWPGAYGGMLLIDLLLGAAALFAFHGILRALDPEPEHAAPRALAVAALSTHPALLGCAVNLTPDYGVAVFFVLLLWALLSGRTFVAALAGGALVFSKETGVLLYFLAAVLAELVPIAASNPRGSRREALVRRALLSLPLAAAGVYYLLRLRGGGGLWAGETPRSILLDVLNPGLGHAQLGYVFWMIAAQFQWVLLVPIAAAVVVAARRSRRGILPRPETLFLAGLVAGTGYLLTRYVTFTNPRYFLPMAPLVVAAGYLALASLPLPRGAAGAALTAVAALFAFSSVRTADPLTRAMYGTFPFGRHELLRATSFTGECCGYGRDQLVYNLEYTELHALLDRTYAALRPGPGTLVMTAPDADFYLSSALDVSFHRTLRGKISPLRSTEELRVMRPLPPHAFFIAFPNVDNRRPLAQVATFYDVQRILKVEDRGYALDVYVLARRPPGTGAP